MESDTGEALELIPPKKLNTSRLLNQKREHFLVLFGAHKMKGVIMHFSKSMLHE